LTFGDRPPATLCVALRAGLVVNLFMFYTYILKSDKDGKLYIGWTNDLKARFIKHQKGLVISTKDRRPFQLIYYEACLIKEDAIRREKALKTGFGRAYIKRRISNI